MNTFLQTWTVPTRGGRAAKIHKETARMLKAAKNQNVNFMTIRLSQQLKQELPAWFQVGADHWAINNRSAKCLLNKHKAKTIADLMKVSARIRDNTNPLVHRPTNYCNCPACADDQRKDCTHSHDCATEALARINRTLPKLNPLGPGIRHDNLSLTNRRKNQNRKAREENGKITFDPSITTKDDISECFRVFTDPQRSTRHPAQRPQNNGANNRHEEMTVYTDGSCTDNGKENAKSGGGAWFGQNDPRNKALRVPGESHSNQIGELAAVIVALQNTPRFYPLEIVSDSKYVIDGLTSHLREWEDRGWIGIQNATLFKKAASGKWEKNLDWLNVA
jgi:ribonuclease HI